MKLNRLPDEEKLKALNIPLERAGLIVHAKGREIMIEAEKRE